VQSFQKSDKLGWVQASSKGVERTCTAEQVLSHILPFLANKQKYEKLATLKVEVKMTKCAECGKKIQELCVAVLSTLVYLHLYSFDNLSQLLTCAVG